MKIVFATNNIGRGGKERQLFIMASSLLQSHERVYILTLSKTSATYIHEYSFPEKNIAVVEKNDNSNRRQNFQRKILKYSPDVVFSYDMKTAAYMLMMGKNFKGKFINGCIQHGVRLANPTHFMRSFICWLSPYVVANSHAGLKANNISSPAVASKNFVLYNGIEKKFCIKKPHGEMLPQKKSELLNIKNIDNKKPVFITVANLVPFKDYFTVLKSLRTVKNKYEFYYIILGDGPDKISIKKTIDEYGLSNNVFLPGAVVNVHDFLSISDYMIHSSRGEGVSNAILEGMFAGLPVIATNVGGVPETVYKKSSKLFEYKDVAALTDILINIEDSFPDFNCFSDEYQQHLKKFSVETMMNNFENIINKVLSR